MIIAIDGPSAAGKGALAGRLARHLGFAHLDTGALYRAVALRVLRAGGDPTDTKAATAAARQLSLDDLDDAGIRDEVTGEAASQLAVIPEVRREMLAFQRTFASDPPDGAQGAVLEGRDIGTVVCPEAEVKLFLTASLGARAHRRFLELRERGATTSEEKVLEDMRARDERDRMRGASPLRQAADAHLLDTTNLSINSVFARANELIAARRA